jgi:carbon-monoxide dehydrogenase small subunit
MLVTAKALLDSTANPSREQIVAALAGNLCRCTGYGRIFAAVRQVQQERARDPD